MQENLCAFVFLRQILIASEPGQGDGKHALFGFPALLIDQAKIRIPYRISDGRDIIRPIQREQAGRITELTGAVYVDDVESVAEQIGHDLSAGKSRPQR